MILKALLFPEDYFRWLWKFFKMFGLYGPKQHKWRIIYHVFSLPHLILTMLSIILDLLNIVLNQETFQRKMLNVGVLSMHTAAGLRVLSWLWTKDKLEEVIVGVIQRPSFKFDIFGYNGRTQKRTPIEAFKSTTLRNTNLICCAIYMIVFSYICFNFVITYTCNYFRDTQERFNPALNRTSLYRDFPYPMWFPFDVSVSDGYYLLAFFYQPYAYYSLMASFWCVDWLILSSIIHLQNQVTVVAFALTQVDRNIAKGIGEERFSIKKKRLNKCVQELNEIFRAADLLEELCNSQLLVQNGLATFILCTLLYVSTTLTVPMEVSYVSAAAGIVLLEPFTQCWICQNFTMEFNKVLEEIYKLDWVNYPPNLRRCLVLTMVKLQKSAVFTLGKWRVIDVSFYLQLLRMTYSFYTLISR